MNLQFSQAVFWWGLSVMVSLAAWSLAQNNDERPEFIALTLVMTALVWFLSTLIVIPSALQARAFAPARRLRTRPFLYWWAILGALVGGMLWWGWLKHIPQREHFYLWFYIWACMLLFVAGWRAEDGRVIAERLRNSRWTGAMMTITSLSVMLVLIEIVMRITFVFSDGYGFSLMNARWFNEYWNPSNAQGYRDYEIAEVGEGVQRVVVVGDSFTVGHGVRSIDQTFPHVAADLLGEGYTVNVVAKPGWNTDNEWVALQDYPLEPDILVLAYYINDMTYLISDYGEEMERIYPLPPFPLSLLVEHFYLPNFIYWHVWGQIVRRGNTVFTDMILAPYTDETLWAEQERWLKRFVDYADQHQARMVVMVWGALNATEASAPAVNQVAAYFQGQGIPVLKMDDYIGDLSIPERVVNPFDSHPSERVHAIAGQQLYEMLRGLDD